MFLTNNVSPSQGAGVSFAKIKAIPTRLFVFALLILGVAQVQGQMVIIRDPVGKQLSIDSTIISIYPNPVTQGGTLTVEPNPEVEVFELSVLDASGTELYNTQSPYYQTHQLYLPVGVYVFRLDTSQGMVYRQIVVIED